MKKRKIIMIVDGQGGGLGKAIVEKLKRKDINAEILGVGTNTTAAMVMLKAGCDDAATGENAVIHNAGRADYIIGGIGIIAANSMLGEITPAMANSISTSEGMKLLIPTNKCNLFVAGVQDGILGDKIDEVLLKIQQDMNS